MKKVPADAKSSRAHKRTLRTHTIYGHTAHQDAKTSDLCLKARHQYCRIRFSHLANSDATHYFQLRHISTIFFCFLPLVYELLYKKAAVNVLLLKKITAQYGKPVRRCSDAYELRFAFTNRRTWTHHTGTFPSFCRYSFSSRTGRPPAFVNCGRIASCNRKTASPAECAPPADVTVRRRFC